MSEENAINERNEENVKLSENDKARIEEINAYEREMNLAMEEDAINAKAQRQQFDRIFRIVGSIVVIMILGIVLYKYLRGI